jgi:predicted RNA-binding protein with PIN domain
MALLIDGYNLLHVTGLVGRPGSGLQGSRDALLRYLARSIEPKELVATTIVFDAAEAPPGLPRVVTHEGMVVRYASDYPDADALIEELIAAFNVPRSLLVVSSDHRIQRAAHRRRAQFVDSDVWMGDLSRRRSAGQGASQPEARRTPGLSANDIAYWVAEFADAPEEAPPQKRGAKRKPSKPPEEPAPPIDNPFPPGYGEDLLGDQ